MSKLAAALQYRDSGERKILRQPFRYIYVTENFKEIFAVDAPVYHVTASFKSKVIVSRGPQETTNGIALVEAVDRCKKQIIGGVFGEYVAPLHQAIQALDRYEVEEARRILQAVINNFEQPFPFGGEYSSAKDQP